MLLVDVVRDTVVEVLVDCEVELVDIEVEVELDVELVEVVVASGPMLKLSSTAVLTPISESVAATSQT